MKILHYIPTYAPAWNWGGPVVSTTSLCEELARAGHRVRVLTTDAGLRGEIPACEVNRNGVSVRYCRRVTGAGIHSPEMEQQVAVEIASFDLMHVTGVWQRTSPAACRAATNAGVPYVVSPRGALGRYSWGQKTLKKLGYYLLRERSNLRNAAGFHFTSSMEAAECRRFAGERPACMLPNSVAASAQPADRAGGPEWKRRHGVPGDCPILLYAGRLHHKKGLDLLPAALAGIRDLNWQMIFVGDDEDRSRPALERDFSRAGLVERVRFLPAVPKEQLPVIYSMASCFLLPSRHENFGNVAIEALSCGCPCLLSDQVGAAKDVQASGGVLLRARCAPLWSEALRDVLSGRWQHPDRDALAGWTIQEFDASRLASMMADFYSLVITNHTYGRSEKAS